MIHTDLPCVSLSCFFNTSMYITIDGSLWVSGYNRDFTRVEGLPPICQLECKTAHTVLIDNEGNVWISLPGDDHSFVKIAGITHVVSICCTNILVYAICDDDSRWVMSYDGFPPGKRDEKTGDPVFVPLDYLPILTPIESIDTKRQRVTQ